MPKKANKKIVPKAAAKTAAIKKIAKPVIKTNKTKTVKKPVSKPIKKAVVSTAKKSAATKTQSVGRTKKPVVVKKETKKPAKTIKSTTKSKITTKKLSAVKPKATSKKTTAAVKTKTTTIKTKTPPKKVIKTMSKSKPQAKPPSSTTSAKSPARSAKKSTAANVDVMPYSIDSKEEYMNEEQRKHIEQILLTLKSALQEEVDRTITHMQEEPANVPDVSDRASLEENFGVELRTRDRERLLLKKIDDALERVRRDDFGYCETCGIEIGLRRLEARPTATMCIDCKEIAEVKEKQESGY